MRWTSGSAAILDSIATLWASDVLCASLAAMVAVRQALLEVGPRLVDRHVVRVQAHQLGDRAGRRALARARARRSWPR